MKISPALSLLVLEARSTRRKLFKILSVACVSRWPIRLGLVTRFLKRCRRLAALLVDATHRLHEQRHRRLLDRPRLLSRHGVERELRARPRGHAIERLFAGQILRPGVDDFALLQINAAGPGAVLEAAHAR